LGLTEKPECGPMVMFFRRLIKDASGVTAIEYGLIAALIVITSIAALNQVSSSLNLSGTLGLVASKL
jgi:Flp pilus assembly pilin Flp